MKKRWIACTLACAMLFAAAGFAEENTAESVQATVNKHSSLLNGRLAKILMEMHTDVCNLSQNAPGNKKDSWMDRGMDKWIIT